MKRIRDWLCTITYLTLSIVTLCVWDLLLKVVWAINKRLHKYILDRGIFLLTLWLRAVGTRPEVRLAAELPRNRPIIFVSNHQSLLDVPLLMWHLRHHTPLFVAKLELGRFFPSVAHTLRNNGSALIDRSSPAQSMAKITTLGKLIEDKNHSACIFPEGTRSRSGQLRTFKVAGLKALLEASPSALLVPVCIAGSWRIAQHNFLPVPFGSPLRLTILAPIERRNQAAETLLKLCQEAIATELSAAVPPVGVGHKRE